MQKSKKFITAFLATIMVMSTAACGGNASQNSSSQQSAGVSSATSATGEEKTGYDTHVELSWFKEGITGHEINYDGDAYGQFWQDKFNTTFDLTAATMDDSDWSQRLRIWINSGDMPDVAHWGFNYGELVDYAAQDAVYRFPDDWKERWPNVAASQECVPGAAVAEEKLGGTYTLFRTIFANHRPSKRLSYHALLYMRKDWMQACGVEIKDTYSPSELEEIATKFKEEDPGNVGSQLVPISIRTYDVPKIYPGTYFPQSINVGDGYYKDESGQFQWAPADERTLEGLKKYQNLYTSGLLDPEFYTLTRYEGTEKLYMGNVVKYLIVPEGAVIPAGLDKDVIVINQPVESAYVASTDALNILDKLDLTDKVTALGMEKEDCTVDSLTAALEDGSVTFAGKDEDTDYKALVKSQCGISILSSDILPTEEADTEAKENLLKDSAEKYSTLKIPFIVDRSADEKDDNAKAEWEKAYEAIFVTDEEE